MDMPRYLQFNLHSCCFPSFVKVFLLICGGNYMFPNKEYDLTNSPYSVILLWLFVFTSTNAHGFCLASKIPCNIGMNVLRCLHRGKYGSSLWHGYSVSSCLPLCSLFVSHGHLLINQFIPMLLAVSLFLSEFRNSFLSAVLVSCCSLEVNLKLFWPHSPSPRFANTILIIMSDLHQHEMWL